MTIKHDPKTIDYANQKALINLVAAETGYLVYEVEDVLEGLRKVITELLLNDKEVKLGYLFNIKPKVTAPRNLISPITGEPFVSKGSIGLSIRPNAYLKKLMNGGMIEQEDDDLTD